MQFEYSDNDLNKISTDALVIFSSQDEKGRAPTYKKYHAFSSIDAMVDGELGSLALLEKFTGKRGEVLRFIPSGRLLAKRVIVLGLGKFDEMVGDDVRRAVGSLSTRMKKKIRSIAIVLPAEDEGPEGRAYVAQLVTEGLLLGNYEFMQYKEKDKTSEHLETIIFIENNNAKRVEIKKGVAKGVLFADATIVARDLINEQSAVATPTYLAKLAQDIAKSNSQITCKVFDKAELEKMGMHAFLGISRAADTPPKFIHLEYKPTENKVTEVVAIVGKGITFDSGGISIKPGDSMVDMKCDMSGAALVLGVFSVIAKLKPNIRVIGLIAATPNLISGTSIVPGDVVRAMNGKSIEILNTDAEGRVTMADSLSYAVKLGATKIIDFATLTGACMVALGPEVAGLFSNNADFTKEIKSAALTAGEKVWEMPLEKDYKGFNKSDVADIANLANTRYGGAITAGLFLQEFVGDKVWAHLDIAGPAFLSRPSDISGKGGTGFGVRTMLTMLNSNTKE